MLAIVAKVLSLINGTRSHSVLRMNPLLRKAHCFFFFFAFSVKFLPLFPGLLHTSVNPNVSFFSEGGGGMVRLHQWTH